MKDMQNWTPPTGLEGLPTSPILWTMILVGGMLMVGGALIALPHGDSIMPQAIAMALGIILAVTGVVGDVTMTQSDGVAGTMFAAQAEDAYKLTGLDCDLHGVRTERGYPRRDGVYQCHALDRKGVMRGLSLRVDGNRYALYDEQGKAVK